MGASVGFCTQAIYMEPRFMIDVVCIAVTLGFFTLMVANVSERATASPRVATARRVPGSQVAAILAQHVQGRQIGVFGEPRVNVLLLNIAIDSAFRVKH